MITSETHKAEGEIGGMDGKIMPSEKQKKQQKKERKEMKDISKNTVAADGAALTEPLENPIRVDHVPCFYNALNDENWRLSRLRNVCLSARKEATSKDAFNTTYGNTTFQAWEQDVDVGIWPVCSSPDHPFLGVEGQPSWETLVHHFLKAHGGDWKKAERAIRVSLDRYAPQTSSLFVKTRQLAMCISRCDPISFFGLSQEESSKTWCNRYWDKCNARNPRLLVDQRPIAKFWLISSCILGDPWVDPINTDRPEEFDSLQKSLQQEERKQERDNDILPAQDGLAQSTKAPVDPISPARGAFIEPNLQIVQEISSPPKPIKPRGDQPAGWDESGDPNPVTPGAEGQFANQSEVPKNDVSALGNWSVSDDGKGKNNHSKSRQQSTVPVSTIALEELPICTAKSVAFQSLQRENGTDKQQKSNREKFQSDAEMARKAHQIRMDGIPRKSSKFVCLSVATNWPGEEEADAKLQDMMASVIVEGMVQAMSQVPDLMFMPVGDYTFADKTKWITSADQAKKELVSWDKLRIYLDLAWNNGFNLPRQTKTAGDKILRTRIRIAYDSDENLVEPLLDDIYRPTGNGMEIYRSPLQVGNAVKIGWLLNYPTGMGREAVERELMRHFQFTVPIALVLTYPSNPGSYNEKWVAGIHKHAWHVYVPFRYAKLAEQELSMWLTKSTAKPDMPFGSSTQFVIDWNFARKLDQIPVQDLSKDIIQMINTHDTHCHTTEIIKPAFPIHPLVKTYVPFFDKSVSLLRILYSIQCHPTPPPKKEGNEEPVQTVQDPVTEPQTVNDSSILSVDQAAPIDEHETKVADNDGEQVLADDPKSPDKKKRKGGNASPQPTTQPEAKSNQQSHKTPERKKKGKRKKKKASTPSKTKPSTPQQDPLTALEIAVTPADKSAIAAAQQAQTPETAEQFQARLLSKDATNFQPSMLFLLILPSEVEGYMIFIVRKKYKALVESILNNLAAFLIYYLELWKDPENERRTLRQWLCKRHIELTTRYGMTWDEPSLSAVSELDKNVEMDIDENDDWLSALTPANATSSVFKGTISLNLKLASVKGIDDGATVVSRINELRRLHQAAQHHAEMVDELAAKEMELQEKDKALNEKDEIIKSLQAQLAAQQIGKDTKMKEAKDDESEEDEESSVEGDEDEDDIAGEYEADEYEGESDDEDEPENPAGNDGDDITGLHNESTAQADAGGGSSGSGS